MRKTLFLVSALAMLAGCATPPQRESTVGDYLAGRFAARTNDVERAASAFDGARADSSSADVARHAFFFKIASGDIDGAAQLAGAILANDEEQDDDLARLAIAAKATKNGDYAQARDALQPGAVSAHFSALFAIIDAWALDGLEGPEPALRALAEKNDEMFRGFHPLHQAFLFEQAGLYDEARTAYQLAMLSYGGVVSRDAYGSFLERRGETDAAREHYELLAQYQGPDRQLALKGMKRLDQGKTDKVWAKVTPAKGAAAALYSFGGAVLQQSIDERDAAEKAGFNVGDANYDMPLAFTQIALYLDPSFDHAQRLAGSILNAYGDNDRAIAILQKIPASSPFYTQAQIEVAAGLVAREREAEALKRLRAAAKDPEALEAKFALGNLLVSLGREREGVAAYGDLISRLPEDAPEDSWRFYVARGAALIALDRWPDAEKDLKRAVEVAPKQATALNYLGYSWAERGENIDEAFKLIEQAVAIEPNSGAFIDSLGWAHYQRGDYAEAVGHLEHAASLEPGDPTVTDHLGDAYWRLGREKEAGYEWKRVLELEPDDKLRAAVEKKLKDGLPDDGK
ncbi:MAG: tetratricopeptide repeat protein [Parvularculaceae bacterium]